MFKRVAGLFGAVLLVAITAYANDPWKDKDFASWDEKDVQRVLQESPWSHKVQFGMAAASGGIAGAITATGNNGTYSDSNVAGSGTVEPGPHSRNNTSGSGGGGSETSFTVSWISSRTIREAMARRRELGGVSAEEARKDLDTIPDSYRIVVASSNMMAFARATEDELKAQTYLMLKSTKAKIVPSRVALQKGRTGNPVAIFFIFDKKTATGEPTFAPDEKGVEFNFQAGKTLLKITFDFTKMQNKQGLDL